MAKLRTKKPNNVWKTRLLYASLPTSRQGLASPRVSPLDPTSPHSPPLTILSIPLPYLFLALFLICDRSNESH